MRLRHPCPARPIMLVLGGRLSGPLLAWIVLGLASPSPEAFTRGGGAGGSGAAGAGAGGAAGGGADAGGGGAGGTSSADAGVDVQRESGTSDAAGASCVGVAAYMQGKVYARGERAQSSGRLYQC